MCQILQLRLCRTVENLKAPARRSSSGKKPSSSSRKKPSSGSRRRQRHDVLIGDLDDENVHVDQPAETFNDAQGSLGESYMQSKVGFIKYGGRVWSTLGVTRVQRPLMNGFAIKLVDVFAWKLLHFAIIAVFTGGNKELLFIHFQSWNFHRCRLHCSKAVFCLVELKIPQVFLMVFRHFHCTAQFSC